jgi:hypothetical protein
MDANYYVVVRPGLNDLHGIHKDGCPFLADDDKSIYLGRFEWPSDAEKAGLKHFTLTKCCTFCARESRASSKTFGFKSTMHLQTEAALFCGVN